MIRAGKTKSSKSIIVRDIVRRTSYVAATTYRYNKHTSTV